MKKHVVLDTNVLLDNLDSLDIQGIPTLLSHTLRELEKHKISHNQDLAYRARQATRFIEENVNMFHFDLKDYSCVLGNDFDPSYQDNNILQACVDNSYFLLTNDVLLRQKARGFGVEIVDSSKSSTSNYKGYKEFVMSDNEMAELYQDVHKNILNLETNQYLLIKNKNNETVDKRKWNGNKLIELKLPPSKVLKPWNDLQAFALDLLNDTSIPIKIVSGTYGSGKTMLSINMALYHLRDKGNYSKIMAVRNPIGSGEAVGFLKGTKEDKIGSFFKPIEHQLAGGEFELQSMIQRGQLECEVPFYMKGMSLNGGYFMIVDEAQDMDLKTLKLIGTRIGKDSAICLCGDYKQAESKFLHNNGLNQAINKLKGNPLVGIVVMDEDVRSEASKVFADLD